MKSFKNILLVAVFFAGLEMINQTLSVATTQAVASLRVRTVPASTDQKKKDVAPEATPKTQSTFKEVISNYCDITTSIKTKLAVADGGAPK